MSAISGSKVAAVLAIARSTGYAPRARRTAAQVASIEARKSASVSSWRGSSARPSTESDSSVASRVLGGAEPDRLSAMKRTVSAVASRAAATSRGSVSGCELTQPGQPGGVCAKRVTASTIRSNSRALRAPECM